MALTWSPSQFSAVACLQFPISFRSIWSEAKVLDKFDLTDDGASWGINKGITILILRDECADSWEISLKPTLCQRHGGAREKSGYISLEPWMSVWNFMAIHPIAAKKSVDPSINYLWRLILCTVAGGWDVYQLTVGKSWGTPWTGCQFITGMTKRHKQLYKLTPMSDLESQIDLNCISLDCGRKLQHPQRQGDHANTTQSMYKVSSQSNS